MLDIKTHTHTHKEEEEEEEEEDMIKCTLHSLSLAKIHFNSLTLLLLNGVF